MQERIEELRGKYAADGEALAALGQLDEEPEMHRLHSSYYAYEFFVARRAPGWQAFTPLRPFVAAATATASSSGSGSARSCRSPRGQHPRRFWLPHGRSVSSRSPHFMV